LFSKSIAEEIILKECRVLKRLKRGFLKIFIRRYLKIIKEGIWRFINSEEV
jgi:hypothetical protein